MDRRLLFGALVVLLPAAISAQALNGVALGARVRLTTVDGLLKEREMYLLDVRPDSLVLRELKTPAPTTVLRTSVHRLDIYRPSSRTKSERRNLWAGFGAVGCAVIGAALPSNSLASTRGQAAMTSALGGAGLGWWAGFLTYSPGQWEPAITNSGAR